MQTFTRFRALVLDDEARRSNGRQTAVYRVASHPHAAIGLTTGASVQDMVASYVSPFLVPKSDHDSIDLRWSVDFETLSPESAEALGKASGGDGWVRTHYGAIDSVLLTTQLPPFELYHQSIEGRFYQFLAIDGGRIVARSPTDGTPPHLVAMRLIRALMVLQGIQAGGLHVHASGVVRDQEAHLFLGDKFDGKTTTMLGLLRRGCDFLSNDHVLISPQGPVAAGVPLAIGIRPGTLELYPEPAEYQRQHDPVHSVRERDTKMMFAPCDLASSFGVRIVPSARLRNLVFLSLDLSADRLSVTHLRRAEAADLLRRNILPNVHKKQPFWDSFVNRGFERREDAIQAIAESVDAVRVVYNHRVLDDLVSLLFGSEA